jgi:phosphoribosyl 1,2-cyclic phosphodiesterase
MARDFLVKFLGVRGSVPCASSKFEKYGGNTSCVLVHVGHSLIIFDAGSGIKDAGEYVCHHHIKKVHLFLTHLHLDHILGMPFFKPIWNKDIDVIIYCGTAQPFGGLSDALASFFTPPYFPISFDKWPANITCIDFKSVETYCLEGEVVVETCPLTHPNGSIGYKVSYKQKAVCYITDHEHGNQIVDKHLEEFIQEADMMIYDASYDDCKYEQGHKGWGHSTWQKACELMEKSSVKQVALFHHDPDLDDGEMDILKCEIESLYDNVFIAHEGQTINL